MRILYSVCCLIYCCLYTGTAYSYFNSSSDDISIWHITTKQTAEPKPLYLKYASVEFIANTGHVSYGPQNKNKGILIKKASCPSGTFLINGSCLSQSTCENSYPLLSVDSQAGAFLKVSCGKNRYCYMGCNEGWYKEGCHCYENKCDGYSLSSSSGCSEAQECQKGKNLVYKCTGCPEGFDLLNGVCVAKPRPENCPYNEQPSTNNGTVASRQYGNQKCYYYTSCYAGYDGPSRGDCSAKACLGFGSSSEIIAHCNSTSYCQKGNTKVYKCVSCQSGYAANNSGICEIIMCPTGKINPYSYWCSDAWRCLMPAN